MSDEKTTPEPEPKPEPSHEELRPIVERIVSEILSKQGKPAETSAEPKATVRAPGSPMSVEADFIARTREAMKILAHQNKEEEERIRKIVEEQKKPEEPKTETPPDVRSWLQRILSW